VNYFYFKVQDQCKVGGEYFNPPIYYRMDLDNPTFNVEEYLHFPNGEWIRRNYVLFEKALKEAKFRLKGERDFKVIVSEAYRRACEGAHNTNEISFPSYEEVFLEII